MSTRMIRSTAEVFIRDTSGEEFRVRVIGDTISVGGRTLVTVELKKAIQRSEAIYAARDKYRALGFEFDEKPEENL